MPFTLLQVGNTLKSVNTDGGLSAALTLPLGIAMATNVTPRFAKYNRYVIVVNTPQRPVTVDVNGVVRPLTPLPPSSAVALSAGAAGALTGTYRALQTYKLLDSLGNVISESDYGPAMVSAVTVAASKLHAVFPLSAESISANQLYRTTTNGAVYFPWSQVAGNTTATLDSDLSDAAMGIVAGPELGSAPDLTLIAEWEGRLWGVDRVDIDTLRYTQAGTMYAWNGLNALKVPHVGADETGVTALMARRAALGVARRDMLLQVTGSQRSNFKPTVVNGGENVGVLSQESAVVFNDVGYFLWRDGVYRWDSEGVSCITNGRVRSWFTTDTYFNRSMFWRAFGQFDPIALKYRLFLASRGSAVHDRWIEFDLMTNTWWGPHKTDAFTPTSALLVAGRNQQPYFMIGSREGYLSQQQSEKNDWDAFSIPFSAVTSSTDSGEPDLDKYHGELTMIGEPQPAGNLTITPTVGELEGTVAQTPFNYDMTKSRERLYRLGVGKQLTLQFDNDTINQDVALFGYVVDPVHIVGKR